jgi:hypothetical protein
VALTDRTPANNQKFKAQSKRYSVKHTVKYLYMYIYIDDRTLNRL